ncbi:hypothetical protein NDU88_009033 [Pleurodeles waltl]|uniref:Uncharacterized protein n=1 Tax=Pleurodeles waltl TaxID=8319 RepID=A0AAV7QU80_PLEWA|nr:hypothetical protein NDU88_009033 [Pleurodeles waltl]
MPLDLIWQLESTLEKHNGMFDRVLKAIQDPKTAIETHLGVIQMENGLDHAKLAEKMDGAESSLTSLQPSLAAMQDQLNPYRLKYETSRLFSDLISGKADKRVSIRMLLRLLMEGGQGVMVLKLYFLAAQLQWPMPWMVGDAMGEYRSIREELGASEILD